MKITKSELRNIIQEVAEEMGLLEGLTKAQEKLPEPLKKAILKKQGKASDSDEKEDVEEGLTKAQEKLPEPLKKAILKKQGKSADSSDDEKEDVEEGLTKAQEKLPEPLKKAILKKQGKSADSSDEEKEDVEESIREGNAFGAAVKAARENGDSEFVVGGKTYQLKEKVTEDVEDTEEFTGEIDEQSNSSEIGKSNNHVDVADCKDCEDPQGTSLTNEELEEASCGTHEEDEDDVEEGNAFGDAVRKAKEDGETEFSVGGKTYKVRENWSKISLSEKLDRILGNRKVL